MDSLMGELNLAKMSREELIQLIVENRDTLDTDVLKQALDRIDILAGKENTETEIAIAEINNEAFDDLPAEEQLGKLMKAAQLLSREATKYGVGI